MAAKTFNPSGSSANWSDTTAWGGSIPVSGDTATISANKTCIFDVDQSGMAAGLAGLTINGILQCSTSAGSYVLKMDGTSGHNIVFGSAGQLLAGSAGTPLPANVTFTINLNGASAISAGSNTSSTSPSILLYAQQPTHLYCKLTAGVSAAATVLPVDTDLTAEAPWLIASARVCVDNVNKVQDSEARLISSISSTQITLTAGLTNAKVAGTFVHLVQRNIRITGGTNASGSIQNPNYMVFQAELSGITGVGFNNAINPVLSGVVSGPSGGSGTAIQNGYSGTVSGVVTGGWSVALSLQRGTTLTGLITGCGSALVQCYGCFLTATSQIAGITTAVNQVVACVVAGAITGCGSAIFYGSGMILSSATLNSNTQDINAARGGKWVGYGVTLGSATQILQYGAATTTTDVATLNQWIMWDYAGTAGALRGWMIGGRLVDTTSVLPGDSRVTRSINHIFESMAGPVYLDYPIRLEAGVNTFVVFMRKDTHAMTETPNAQIILPGSDPLLGGTAAATVTMADNENTWQTLILSYNSTVEQNALVRVRGTHGSGNAYHAVVRVPRGTPRRAR